MQVAFLVGNGFDIQAGLKTRYSDFYNFLEKKSIENPSLNDNSIFRDIRIPNNEKKWSNFELGLMELTKDCIVDNGEDNNSLSDKRLAYDKQEIESYLGDYLDEITSHINVEISKDKIKSEFIRSFSEILSVLRPQRLDEIRKALPLNSTTNEIRVNVIDFNYTSLLQDSYALLDKDNLGNLNKAYNNNKITMKKNLYVKVHGETKKDMVLGGNDITQLGDNMHNSEFKYYFIKQLLSENIGYNNYVRGKAMVNNSHLYCIFGMSLGETDRSWWEQITNNLIKNTNKSLIIFEHSPDKNINDKPLEYITRTNSVKKRFLRFVLDLNEEQKESLANRIFVVFNSNLFNLSKIKLNEELLTK